MKKESLEAALIEHKAGYAGKLYKQQADAHKTQQLQQDIQAKSALFFGADKRTTVNFNDLEDVKQRTRDYLEACANTGTFPSMMGLAAYGYGVSRQALYWRLKNHPDAETSRFIDRVRDLIADVLTSASLMRNADAVTTIFILKNGLGFADRVEIEPVTQQSTEPVLDKEELMKRYEL